MTNFLKFVTCTTFWNNCFMQLHESIVIVCHLSVIANMCTQRDMNLNRKKVTHLFFRLKLHENACEDTFSSLFNAFHLHQWPYILFTVCPLYNNGKNTQKHVILFFATKNDHRLFYWNRWNFATCIRIMHFHVLLMQFPACLSTQIFARTYIRIHNARHCLQHVLIVEKWQETVNFEAYNFVKCWKEEEEVNITHRRFNFQMNYLGSSVNFQCYFIDKNS